MNTIDFKFAIERGIIIPEVLQEQIDNVKRKEILENHKYSTWEDKGFWFTYLPDPTKKYNRRQVKRKYREQVEDEIIKYYKEHLEEPTVEECFTRWSSDKLNHKEIAKQTFDRYETDFKRFFSEFGKLKIKDVTEDDLYDFCKGTITDNKLTAKAWGNVRTLIIGTWKYAKRKHYTDLSISQFMGDIDISKHSFRVVHHSDEEEVFTSHELECLYQQINKEPPSMLTLGVELALETGIRAGELAVLKPEDVVDNCLIISKTEQRYKGDDGYIFDVKQTPKGKFGTRKVFLTPRGVEIISKVVELNPNGEFLFEKNGKRMRGKAFSQKCVWLCNKVGIPPKSLHKCRKTYATRLINEKVDEGIIRSQMGHVDFTTTKDYYYYNDKDEDEARKIVMDALITDGNKFDSTEE